MAAILIVDDDDAIREVFYELFEDEHQCHTAENAERALELIRAEAYDVILMDVSMPGMSGLELLAHTRQLQPDTPVIIITGIDYRQHFDALVETDAFDYLLKPFTLEDAQARVSRALRLRERKRGEVGDGAAGDIEQHEWPTEEDAS